MLLSKEDVAKFRVRAMQSAFDIHHVDNVFAELLEAAVLARAAERLGVAATDLTAYGCVKMIETMAREARDGR